MQFFINFLKIKVQGADYCSRCKNAFNGNHCQIIKVGNYVYGMHDACANSIENSMLKTTMILKGKRWRWRDRRNNRRCCWGDSMGSRVLFRLVCRLAWVSNWALLPRDMKSLREGKQKLRRQ